MTTVLILVDLSSARERERGNVGGRTEPKPTNDADDNALIEKGDEVKSNQMSPPSFGSPDIFHLEKRGHTG